MSVFDEYRGLQVATLDPRGSGCHDSWRKRWGFWRWWKDGPGKTGPQGARLNLTTGHIALAGLWQRLRDHPAVLTAVAHKMGKLTDGGDHESEHDLQCSLVNQTVICIGYSKHDDPKGFTHGWVEFGSGHVGGRGDCLWENKEFAVNVMLTAFRFAPAAQSHFGPKPRDDAHPDVDGTPARNWRSCWPLPAVAPVGWARPRVRWCLFHILRRTSALPSPEAPT